MTPRIKICGLTRAADVDLAIGLGAGYVGCVVAPDSPRACRPAMLDGLRAVARGRAKFVLVVRGLAGDEVMRLVRRCTPDFVQWHGAIPSDEAALARCAPLIRVRAVAGRLPDCSDATADRPLLLDRGRGGAGRPFDWSLLGMPAPPCVFVAGGITPENIGWLLPREPWGIDASSGVESAPGRKDPARLRALFSALEVVW